MLGDSVGYQDLSHLVSWDMLCVVACLGISITYWIYWFLIGLSFASITWSIYQVMNNPFGASAPCMLCVFEHLDLCHHGCWFVGVFVLADD